MSKKSAVFVLLAVMLQQSCVVYQKTPVALEDAYDRGRVKVIFTDGSKLKIKNLKLEADEVYYHNGFEKDSIIKKSYVINHGFPVYDEDGKPVVEKRVTYALKRDSVGNKIPIYVKLTANVDSIHLKDKGGSVATTVLLVLGATPVIIVLGTLIFWSIYGVV
jgi:hypothetical protein